MSPRKLLCSAVALLSLYSHTVVARGIVDAMGETWSLTAELHSDVVHGACEGINRNEARIALRAMCGRPQPTTSRDSLFDIERFLRRDTLDDYFAALAHQHAEELKCGSDTAAKLKSNDELLSKIGTNLRLLRSARREWAGAVDAQLASGGPMCPKVPENLDLSQPASAKRQQLCSAIRKAKEKYTEIQSVIPLGGEKNVAEVVTSYVEAKDDLDDRGLEDKLKDAYNRAGSALAEQSSKLKDRANAQGTAPFDTDERHALLADPLVVDKIVATNPKLLKPVDCLANARYGTGASDRDNSLGLGSLVLGGAAMGLAKVGAYAMRATRAVTFARAVGETSLEFAHIVRVQAASAAFTSAVTEARKKCQRTDLTTKARAQRTCVSAPTIEQIDADFCGLQVALAGLDAAGLAASTTVVKLLPLAGARLSKLAARSNRVDEAVVPLPPELNPLKESARITSNSIKIVGEQRVLVIKSLTNDAENFRFMAQARKAVREGLVDKIDAGTIVGPKVLPMILRLREEVPAGRSVIITGWLSPRQLTERMDELSRVVKPENAARVDSNYSASAIEVLRFKKAYQELGIEAACLARKACNGVMDFTWDASRPTSEIVWH